MPHSLNSSKNIEQEARRLVGA